MQYEAFFKLMSRIKTLEKEQIVLQEKVFGTRAVAFFSKNQSFGKCAKAQKSYLKMTEEMERPGRKKYIQMKS